MNFTLDEWGAYLREWRSANPPSMERFQHVARQFCTDMREGLQLNQPKKVRVKSVRLLQIAGDWIVLLPDVADWIPVMESAIEVEVRGQSLKDQHKIHVYLGCLYLQSGLYKKACDCFIRLRESAFENKHPLAEMEAKIGIDIAGVYLHPFSVTEEYASELIARHSHHPNADMQMRLYQAVAYGQIFWNTMSNGPDMAHLAYIHWQKRRNPIEMGRTAYILSVIHRTKDELDHAQLYLNEAEALFRDTDYIWQYCNVAFESGSIALIEGDFQGAVRWFRKSLDKLLPTGDFTRITINRLSLGIAMAYEQADLNGAEALLDRVIADLEAQPTLDVGHLVNAYNCKGFIEAKRDDSAAAMRHLDQGMKLVTELPDGHFKTFVVAKYEYLFSAIKNGVDPDLLVPWLSPKPQRSAAGRG